MKRFRVTLLAVCLLLAWLGYSDLSLFLRNSSPQKLTITQLETDGARQEWLLVSGGYQDLMQAINMSGTMEIDSFLVPLKRSSETADISAWFETRDPRIVELLKTYYFKLDTDSQREKFIQDNHDFIYSQRDVTGMTVDNLVAESNREKLKKLLHEMKMPVPDNVIFISEGKEPVALRGIFFTAVAIIALIKLGLGFRSSGRQPQATAELKN